MCACHFPLSANRLVLCSLGRVTGDTHSFGGENEAGHVEGMSKAVLEKKNNQPQSVATRGLLRMCELPKQVWLDQQVQVLGSGLWEKGSLWLLSEFELYPIDTERQWSFFVFCFLREVLCLGKIDLLVIGGL